MFLSPADVTLSNLLLHQLLCNKYLHIHRVRSMYFFLHWNMQKLPNISYLSWSQSDAFVYFTPDLLRFCLIFLFTRAVLSTGCVVLVEGERGHSSFLLHVRLWGWMRNTQTEKRKINGKAEKVRAGRWLEGGSVSDIDCVHRCICRENFLFSLRTWPAAEFLIPLSTECTYSTWLRYTLRCFIRGLCFAFWSKMHLFNWPCNNKHWFFYPMPHQPQSFLQRLRIPLLSLEHPGHKRRVFWPLLARRSFLF